MKKNNLYSMLRAGTLLTTLLMTFALVLQSCDDEEDAGPQSFTIEGNPTGITSDVAGKTETYTVRGRGTWQIVQKEPADWIKIFPTEGEDDGIFKITVKENLNTFEQRVVNLAFVVNGEEQPVLFRIEQAAAVPHLVLPADMTVQSGGGNFDVTFKTNVEWTYTLSDDSWLTEVSKTASKVTFNAAANKGPERVVTMSVSSPTHPEFSGDFTIKQLPGNIVLIEDFNWLTYGNTIPYETGGERRYDLWTEEEKGRGWTVTPNPGSNNQQLVYARPGFIKLGKTDYGGDLVSPKLSNIDGTQNLKVTFKAAAYISAGGTLDSKELVIEVLGAGTPSQSLIIVDNVPNDEDADLDGVVNDIWAEDRAFSFTVTGATSETQIRFLGKAMDLTAATPNKNRIFMDDIKIEIIE